MTPTVTLIVVTYNSAPVIRACLDALLAQDYPVDGREIVVVDNASRDDTCAILRDEYPAVRLLPLDRNRGFAAANNQAMRASRADFLALVNPDAEPVPGWLSAVVDCMNARQQAAVVGSKVFYGDRVVLQHAGGIIQSNALTAHRGEGELDIGQYDGVTDVDYVIGAAILIRRTAAESLGFFDERFFLYYEETDLCLRARWAGWQVLYCPHAVCIHHEQHSLSGSASTRFLHRYHTSRLRFVLKNYTAEQRRYRFWPEERAWLRTLPVFTERLLVYACYLRARFSR